jgi:hypothetical protein
VNECFVAIDMPGDKAKVGGNLAKVVHVPVFMAGDIDMSMTVAMVVEAPGEKDKEGQQVLKNGL